MPASLPCSSWVWGKLAWLISEGLGERGQGLMITIIGCPWAECALFLTTAACTADTCGLWTCAKLGAGLRQPACPCLWCLEKELLQAKRLQGPAVHVVVPVLLLLLNSAAFASTAEPSCPALPQTPAANHGGPAKRRQPVFRTCLGDKVEKGFPMTCG